MSEGRDQIIFMSRSAEQTEALGAALGAVAGAGLYVALCGGLGGGKTTFTRGLARGLECTGHVQSPTFVLMREYPGRLTLYHADYYRLDAAGDITELELADCLGRGVVAAEWADKFDPPAGARSLTLTFHWVDENVRRIRIRSRGHEPGSDIVRFLEEVIKMNSN